MIQVGDAVLAMPPGYWKANLANRPEWYRPDTHSVLEGSFHISGGFAEVMVSHEIYCFKLASLRKEMVVAQGLGTLLRMLRKLGVCLLGKRVVVMGQGQNGLMATRLCADMKARSVLAVEPLEERRAVAERMGATASCAPDEAADAVARYSAHECLGYVAIDCVAKKGCSGRLTDGKGADIVFEMVGHNTATVSTAAELCCPGGVVMCFGIPDVPVYDDFKFLTFFRCGLPFST